MATSMGGGSSVAAPSLMIRNEASPMMTDETLTALRAELPGIDAGLYLNHGYSGRSPRAVGERIAERQQRWQRLGPGLPLVVAECWDAVEAARSAVAGVVGVAREAVAMTESTSVGLAIV